LQAVAPGYILTPILQTDPKTMETFNERVAHQPYLFHAFHFFADLGKASTDQECLQKWPMSSASSALLELASYME
jgi:hypothetical protein